MKPRATLLALWAASQIVAHAQVGVGTTTPNASAQLDVTSTTLGFLPPRMTSAQRVAIVSPAAGLLVYQTDGSPGLYGYDASTGWTTFSGKESALTFSSPFSRDGATISLATANGTSAGALASADWTTFNNKVSTSRSLATTAPLTGGGTLAGDLTLSLPVATTSANGYLASADWTTFNAKENVLTFSSPLSRSTNGISLPAATGSANGYLASADWTTFNGKVGGSGTANYVPAFTAGGTLGNSAIYSAANGNVGIGTANPNASAILDVTSTTKGFLTPRMSADQKALISSPETGLLIYQTDGTAGFYYHTGSAWTLVGTGSGNGTLTDVTGTAPVVSSGGTTPAISITAASTGAAGSMSAADKIKLDGIATAATNYTHPTGDGNLHVIATGTSNSGKVLTAGASAGSLSWTAPASGTVTSVTATSPIASSGGAEPVISLGTVPVANGGTGATTLTGYIMGTGTTAMTASATIPAASISGNISGNAANVTGTVAVANGGTGATSATVQGGVIYGSSTTVMASTVAGTSGQVLTSNGTSAPTWSSTLSGNAATATSATNLTGGSAGTIAYQTAANATSQLTAGTSGYLLKSNGAAAPSWLSTLPVANGGTGTTNGSITGTTALTFAAGGTDQNVTLTPSGTGYTLLNGKVNIGDNQVQPQPPPYTLSVASYNSGQYTARISNFANSNSAHGLLIRAGGNTLPFGATMIGFQNIDAVAIGNITQNVAFGVAYTTTSDRRLKENITPTHFGLADLMKLQAVDYNFIADPAKTPQTGFIAQDLDAVFPDAVTEGGDDATTKPWSVDYGRVTPLLVQSIQDLKAENDALKADNEAIKADNEAIKAQNAAILKRLDALEAK